MLIRLILLRSLRSRPMRTLLSGFGVMLGVASIVAIGLTNQAAMQSVTRVFEDTSGKANLIVVTSVSNARGFSENAVNRASGTPGVALAVPSVQVRTILAGDAPPVEVGLNFFGADMGGLSLYGIDPALDGQIRQYTIAEGRFLSGDQDANEIVLVQSYAEENEVEVGSWIEVLTPDGFERLRLVGMLAKEGAGGTNSGAFGVLPLRTAQKLFNRSDELDQIDILAAQDSSSGPGLEALKVSLQDRLGKDFTVLFPASQGERMTQMLESYQIGLNFMSGIALFVGAFLIYNAFTMTVMERTRELGLLRTVGMTRRQVTSQVLLEAVFLGFFGSLLGAVMGVLMARGLALIMGSLLGQDLNTIEISWDLIGLSAAVGVSVTFLAAAVPALQAGRISPMEALRIRGVSREAWLVVHGWKVGLGLAAVSLFVLVLNPFPYDVQYQLGNSAVILLFLGGTLAIPVTVGAWEWLARPLMRLIYGNSGRIGASNIRRARLRTTLTVAALMVGVTMILIVQAMTGSFSGDMTEWIDAYIGGDLFVTSSVPMQNTVARRLENVDGVDTVSPVRYIDVKWRTPDNRDETINLMAIDPATHSRVTSFVFSDKKTNPTEALTRLVQGDAVFISSVLSEKYGLKEGDPIYLRTRAGLRPFEIAAVTVDFYNQGLSITGSWKDLRRYFRVENASIYMIKVIEGYDIQVVQDRLDTLYARRYQLTVESNSSIQNRVGSLMDQAFSMFDVLSLVSIVIAAAGIVNTMTMNVMERRREIGMLRSMGMTRWQVVRMILSEAGMMGLIGGILGVAFGLVLSRVLFLAMTTMSGYSLTYVMPSQGILAGLAVTLVISQLAAALPSRQAARTDILEAIQYE